MATQKKTFAQWRSEVNAKVEAAMGLGIDDLEDMDYRGWYDSGVSPTSAAAKVKRMVKQEYGFSF